MTEDFHLITIKSDDRNRSEFEAQAERLEGLKWISHWHTFHLKEKWNLHEKTGKLNRVIVSFIPKMGFELEVGRLRFFSEVYLRRFTEGLYELKCWFNWIREKINLELDPWDPQPTDFKEYHERMADIKWALKKSLGLEKHLIDALSALEDVILYQADRLLGKLENLKDISGPKYYFESYQETYLNFLSWINGRGETEAFEVLRESEIEKLISWYRKIGEVNSSAIESHKAQRAQQVDLEMSQVSRESLLKTFRDFIESSKRQLYELRKELTTCDEKYLRPVIKKLEEMEKESPESAKSQHVKESAKAVGALGAADATSPIVPLKQLEDLQEHLKHIVHVRGGVLPAELQEKVRILYQKELSKAGQDGAPEFDYLLYFQAITEHYLEMELCPDLRQELLRTHKRIEKNIQKGLKLTQVIAEFNREEASSRDILQKFCEVMEFTEKETEDGSGYLAQYLWTKKENRAQESKALDETVECDCDDLSKLADLLQQATIDNSIEFEGMIKAETEKLEIQGFSLFPIQLDLFLKQHADAETKIVECLSVVDKRLEDINRHQYSENSQFIRDTYQDVKDKAFGFSKLWRETKKTFEAGLNVIIEKHPNLKSNIDKFISNEHHKAPLVESCPHCDDEQLEFYYSNICPVVEPGGFGLAKNFQQLMVHIGNKLYNTVANMNDPLQTGHLKEHLEFRCPHNKERSSQAAAPSIDLPLPKIFQYCPGCDYRDNLVWHHTGGNMLDCTKEVPIPGIQLEESNYKGRPCYQCRCGTKYFHLNDRFFRCPKHDDFRPFLYASPSQADEGNEPLADDRPYQEDDTFQNPDLPDLDTNPDA